MSTDHEKNHRGARRPRRTAGFLMLAMLAQLVLIGCSPQTATQSESTVEHTSRASSISSILLEQTPQEMFAGSEVVVLATVGGPTGGFVVEDPVPADTSEAGWRWAYSEWSLAPKKVYKSDGVVRKGSPFTVALRGGDINGVEDHWEEEATFMPGEEVLLFLGTENGPGTAAPGRYFTRQLALGKYRIDRRTGMAVSKFKDKSVKFADLEKKLK